MIYNLVGIGTMILIVLCFMWPLCGWDVLMLDGDVLNHQRIKSPVSKTNSNKKQSNTTDTEEQ